VETTEITVHDETRALTAADVRRQVNLIQEVMRDVMREGEHYGKIPGCGPKPALLKAGAEKLCMTFRLAPEPKVDVVDLGGGHREYRVTVRMGSIQTGRFLGAGVGSASTMESKWRYRTESTGVAVPKEYWAARKANPEAAQAILGAGMSAKKIDGEWVIARRVEHDNPADYYNTCIKMAKKRAAVDAVLTVTAASDIFTQDIEELSAIERQKSDDAGDRREAEERSDLGRTSEGAAKTDLKADLAAADKGTAPAWSMEMMPGAWAKNETVWNDWTRDDELGAAVRKWGTKVLKDQHDKTPEAAAWDYPEVAGRCMVMARLYARMQGARV
jgi:hypothetical protein